MGGSTYSQVEYTARQAQRAATNTPTFAHDADVRSGRASALHETLNVLGKIRESRDSEAHPMSLAVAVLLDVTGSMSSVPRLVQGDLPTLMGLLLTKGYVTDPHILVGAIGDAHGDLAPLQIGQFESGIEIDNDITNLFLEGGGGGGPTSQYSHESYELAMYYMANRTRLDCYTVRGAKGYLFIVGDEMPYSTVRATDIRQYIDAEYTGGDVSVKDVVNKLKLTYNVFYVLPNMTNHWKDANVLRTWKALLGENVLELDDPRELCGLIAATVGLCEGTDLDTLGTHVGLSAVGALVTLAASGAVGNVNPNTILVASSGIPSGLVAN